MKLSIFSIQLFISYFVKHLFIFIAIIYQISSLSLLICSSSFLYVGVFVRCIHCMLLLQGTCLFHSLRGNSGCVVVVVLVYRTIICSSLVLLCLISILWSSQFEQCRAFYCLMWTLKAHIVVLCLRARVTISDHLDLNPTFTTCQLYCFELVI